MKLADVFDALAPHDMVVPRRILPLAYVTAVGTLCMSVLVGFIAGYMLTDDRHADERAAILAERESEARAKNELIRALTEKAIRLQEASAERERQFEISLAAFGEVLERAIDKMNQPHRATPSGPTRPEARLLPQIGPPPNYSMWLKNESRPWVIRLHVN